MGERGNIAVIGWTPDDVVYLYTHWRGDQILDVTRNALARRLRWTDAPYLTRIIFDELNDEPGEETGFGISGSEGDYNYDTVVVDTAAQKVWTASPGSNLIHVTSGPFSFSEFVDRGFDEVL